ncbi:hypothetical protein MKX78_12350 [Cytobacillus sp. FSL R5-0569]|uniref:hypothetical protein n=1 Tax=Cytobacillus sp. FSL R5-0569 TaxID=2921649 RepID=UPI0030F5BC2F
MIKEEEKKKNSLKKEKSNQQFSLNKKLFFPIVLLHQSISKRYCRNTLRNRLHSRKIMEYLSEFFKGDYQFSYTTFFGHLKRESLHA